MCNDSYLHVLEEELEEQERSGFFVGELAWELDLCAWRKKKKKIKVHIYRRGIRSRRIDGSCLGAMVYAENIFLADHKTIDLRMF